jgi:hypothetical protein
MTGSDDGQVATGGGSTADSPRRATIRTSHLDAATARRVAAAVRPDNTASIDTRVDGDSVVTEITRETTGGLQSTIDDYVVNVTVATACTNDPDAAPAVGGTSTTDT